MVTEAQKHNSQGAAGRFLTLPNMLTCSRVLLAPMIAASFFLGTNVGATAQGTQLVTGFGWMPTFSARLVTLALVLLADVSDLLDGQLARRLGQVTDIGKIIDPYADSLYRLTVFGVLAVIGYIPVWVFLMFLYRDTITSVLRVLGALGGVAEAARLSGKIKSLLQGLGVISVVVIDLLRYRSPAGIADPRYGRIIFVLITVIAVYSFLASIDSVVSFLRRADRKRIGISPRNHGP